MTTAGVKPEKCLYEFEGFRVDPVRRRLLRGGEPVALTPKAFSILLILLERRGEIVGKDELIQKVWGDAFVTEANLTQNVSALRKALGERAQDPRVIVTVPGQGYSFVADVVEIQRECSGEISLAGLLGPLAPAPAGAAPPEAVSPDLAAGAERTLDAVSAPAGAAEPPASLPDSAPGGKPREARQRRSFGRLQLAGVVILLLVVTAAGLLALLRSRGPAGGASNRSAIAMLAPKNLSGNRQDDWLRTALTEMVLTELAAGSNLRVVSGGHVWRMEKALAITDTANPDAEALERLHELLGADYLIIGSYLDLGDERGGRIRLDLRVLEVPSGEAAASVIEVGRREELFEMVARAGARLRYAMDWEDLSPEQARAAQALRLANTEATRLYSQGIDRLRAFDPRGARDLLEQAVRADPGAALIRSALAEAWAELGYDARAADEAQRARQLAGSLPRPERLAIEARFHEARKRWDKASEIYRSLWTFFPDEIDYGLQLASSLAAAGRGPQAKEVIAQLRLLPPPAGNDPRVDLVEAEVALSMADHETQLRAAERARLKGRRLGESQVVAQALARRGDALLMTGKVRESIPLFRQARELYRQAGNRPAEQRLLTHLGVALHKLGDLARAEAMFHEALASARRTGSSVGIALQEVNLGLIAQDQGDVQRARPLLRKAYAAFQAAGDRVRAERTLSSIARLHASQGDLAGARRHLDAVRALSRETGNRRDEARAIDQIGMILRLQGLLDEALAMHRQAMAITRSLGDASGEASVLASSAETMLRLGRLGEARQRLEQALAVKRQTGERLAVSQILGALAGLAYEQGDLASFERIAMEQLRIARETGSRPLAAQALLHLSRYHLAVDDLDGAGRHVEEALELTAPYGAELDAIEARVEKGRLALARRQPGEAARLAREAVDWYEPKGFELEEARARSLLAEALLQQGRLAEAQDVGRRPRFLLNHSEDPGVQIELRVATARVDAAAGEVGGALLQLRRAVEEAEKAGFTAAALEARLALGLFQLQRQDRIAGRETLEEVERQARARGFRNLARRAEAALSGRPTAGLALMPLALGLRPAAVTGARAFL